MAVAVDAVGTGAGVHSATSPLTWTHTCGASATHLLVGVHVDQPTGASPTVSATYNSVSMGAAVASTNLSTSAFLYFFAMASPPTGSAFTVSVSVTGGAGFDTIIGGSVSFTGSAALGSQFSNSNVNSSTGITVTLTSTTSTGMCIGMIAAGDSVQTTTSPSTQRFQDNALGPNGNKGGNMSGATSPGTGSSVAMAWTNSSAPTVALAIEVKVSAAFFASPATVVGQGSTPHGMTVVPNSPTVTQAVRRGGYY